MGGAKLDSGSSPHPTGWRFLQFLGLSALALALPVLQMISRAPEFFAGHDLQGVGAMAFCVAVVALPPLLLTSVVWLAGAVTRFAGSVHATLIFVLLFALFSGLLSRVAGIWGVPVALLAAGWVAHQTVQRATASKFAGALALPALVAIGVLIVGSPLADIIAPSASAGASSGSAADSDGAGRAGASQIDVVLLTFDELPLASLLDESGTFDGRLYPAFAELAATATWYPHAASPGTHTPHAVAGVLTGNMADGAAPTARAYPDNLIGWLATSHALHVRETGTRFCGAHCESRGVHAGALATDVAILFAHATLPERLAGWLPPTDYAFSDFAGLTSVLPDTREEIHRSVLREMRADRARPVRDFIAGLSDAPSPVFAYLHAALPHGPFRRLPSGRTHSAVEQLRGDEVDDASGTRVRGGAAEAADHRYHRHLLQLGFADLLLGEITGALGRLGRLDGALVIVLSDHGRSFQLGEGQRGLTGNNLADVLNVPLLVKYPGQARAIVDPRPATLLDVAATVSDVLGAPVPWQVEGQSLYSTAPERTTFRSFDAGTIHTFPYSELARQSGEALSRKFELFRYDPNTRSLVRRVAQEVPIGADATDPRPAAIDFAYEIDQASLLADVRLDSGFVPAELTGRLRGPVSDTLAVLVNGHVAALTPSYEADGERVFAAMVPEGVFREGSNDVRLASLQSGSAGRPKLEVGLSETEAADGRRVDVPTFLLGGRDLPTPERAPEAEVSLTLIYREAGRFHFGGVARERASQAPMEKVVLLSEGRPFYWSAPNRRREYKLEGSPYTSFDFVLPASLVTPRLGTEISVAAIPRSESRLVKGNVALTARCSWGILATLGEEDFGRERAESCSQTP